jgi:hypothetical protein
MIAEKTTSLIATQKPAFSVRSTICVGGRKPVDNVTRMLKNGVWGEKIRLNLISDDIERERQARCRTEGVWLGSRLCVDELL